MQEQLHNRKILKTKRNVLRNHATPAEIGLWSLIKNGMIGKKFRRQHSIGNYILDFYCPEEKLAIELDGQWHDSEHAFRYDQARTKYLQTLGIRVIRFENKVVFEEPELLVQEIVRHYKK